jgi:peptidoglycan-associated lipoprotein
MKNRFRITLLLLAVTLAAALAGCAKKPAATTTPPPAPATPAETTPPAPVTPPPAPEPPPPPPPSVTASDLQIVYFAYDSFILDDGARAALDNNARLLRENTALSVSIDGHCDERGTVEYNQALGQKRAEAVQQYLMDQGLDGARFRVVSYGKERPASEGHDESAWSRNRRVEFSPR